MAVARCIHTCLIRLLPFTGVMSVLLEWVVTKREIKKSL